MAVDLRESSLDARLAQLASGSVHDLISKIARIDEFKGWWSARGLTETGMLERLKKRVVEVSALASTQLDGGRPARLPTARPTHSNARRLAAGHQAAQVAGYVELLRAVFDGHREMEFGEDLIMRFHATLLKYSPGDKGHRGKYKTAADDVRRYPGRAMEPAALRPTIPHLTAEQMGLLTGWTARRLASAEFHPLLVIAGFILELLAIRPFADGNGRLSRVITNFLLLRCGYAYVPYTSLEKAIAERQVEYYLTLRTSQVNRSLSNPDITPWLNAFLEALLVQIGDLKAVADRWHAHEGLLSSNQLHTLRLLDRNGEVTNRLVCTELGIPRDTAKQVLGRLLALGLVKRRGAGRAVRYSRGQDGLLDS